MADALLRVGEDFWNLRGSFKLGGLLDVGTQCSLVRLSSGDFVMLGAYCPSKDVQQQLLDLTEGGRALKAVLHLHPFHTVHVRDVAMLFPAAKQYGTERHVRKAPELAWQALRTDDPVLHASFADDLVFSVPAGVDFIPDNESLHFASVLAHHPRSRSLHVDDTLTWLEVPLLGGLRLHPTLRFVLQRRAGAVAEFRRWSEELLALGARTENLCTAHGRALPRRARGEASWHAAIGAALGSVEGLLDRHARRHG